MWWRSRLEIVNRNRATYLSPISDHKTQQIHNYGRWEQAFRIYSNILTSKYPEKSTELLQYNHTIHLASTSYTWENVYAYDKEFRYHISRYPNRVWNVILQQAWTMILKDRIRHDGGGNNHHRGGNGKKKEPCKRFNQGRCIFGLSCKFDHRCSVKNCGKFGHGAHICRMRDTTTAETKPSAAQHAGHESQNK